MKIKELRLLNITIKQNGNTIYQGKTEALQELSEYEPKLFLNGAEDTTEESGELDESEKT